VGFLNGIGIHIFLGQIGKVFGIPMKAHGILTSLHEFIQLFTSNPSSHSYVGLLTIIVILRENVSATPSGTLLAVVCRLAIVFIWGLDNKGVAVVGPLPAGLLPYAF
jgi:MFS superfamily sulfate permease-like transporter